MINKINESLQRLVDDFNIFLSNDGHVVFTDKGTKKNCSINEVESSKSIIHQKKSEIQNKLLSKKSVQLLFERIESNEFCFRSKAEEFQNRIEDIIQNTSLSRWVNISNEIHFTDLEKFLQEIYEQYRTLFETYKNFNLFSEVLRDSRSVCIIGPNGVGKSTLVEHLKDDELFQIYAIPAQKYLYYYSNYIERKSLSETNSIFLGQNFKEFGSVRKAAYRDEKTELFTQILDTLLREHQKSKSDDKKVTKSLLDGINEIYSSIFPYLRIITNSDKSILEVSNSNASSPYGINSLSDGEKSVLFYTAAVHMAAPDTFFVIDEPETHINLALSLKLWDKLINSREDCKFIFISHDSQFIQSRIANDILWCKHYKDRQDNKLEPLKIKEDNLQEVLIQLSGTRQSVMFCEGTYDSLDYRLLSVLYADDYLVKPVGGHKQVIEYTRAMKKSGFFQGDVIGVIDSDFHSVEELKKYKEDGISSLPTSEIEMIFLHEDVIKAVFERAPIDEKSKSKPTFSEAKKRIKDRLLESLDKMASMYIKYYIETKIFAISEPKNQSDIKKVCYDISINMNEDKLLNVYNRRLEKLKQVFESEDYLSWLKYSMLKGELTKGILNQMENNFQGRAVEEIQRNKELQNTLKKWIGI